MTRELDIEIARLDGCALEMLTIREGWTEPSCGCPVRRHVLGEERDLLCHYSESIDALMAFIRRRWPNYSVRFAMYHGERWAVLCRDAVVGDGEFASSGADDAERLAHAVKQALEAEDEQA